MQHEMNAGGMMMNGLIKNLWRSVAFVLCLAGMANNAVATTSLNISINSNNYGNSTTLVLPNTGVNSASAAQTITLTSSGGTVHVHALNQNNQNFTLVNNTCASNGPGPVSDIIVLNDTNTCTFGVEFTPTIVGWLSGLVTIDTDAGNAPISITLQGNATVPAATTLLTSSANPSSSGQNVTFTAIVAGSSPTGTVGFTADASTISGCGAVTLSAATATCGPISSLSVATHPIVATYSGDLNNAGSTSNTVSQLVNAAGSPSCSLTANGFPSVTITAGQSVTMSASCSNPSTVNWNIPSGGPSFSGVGSSQTFPSVGTYNYSVTNGAITSSTVTVTVNAATTGSCSLTPHTQTITAGQSASLNASCSNPSTVNWTNASGGPNFSSGGGSSTFPNVGTYTYSISNGNGGSDSATVTVNSSGGGGSVANCDSPALDTSPLINTVSNMAASNIASNNSVNRGQAHSYSWTTGASGQGSVYIDMPTIGGTTTTKYLTISTKQCDFSYTYVDQNTGCGSSGSIGSIYYAVGTPVSGSCLLTPNTTYYVNVRNENTTITNRGGNKRGIDTCPAGATCNFLMVRY